MVEGEANRITLAVVVSEVKALGVKIDALSAKLDREIDCTNRLENWQSGAEVKLNYLDKKSNLWDLGNTVFGGIALVIGVIFGTRKI